MAKKGRPTPYREVEEIKIKGKPDEPEREVFARASLSPVMKAAGAISKFKTADADFEVSDLMVVLDQQVSKTLEGSKLEEAQRMLAGQAHTLDAIFNSLAIQAADNIEKDHASVELFMKMALRAQSQSRATWIALSEIKNPRLANVVNQANISSGHQQVNNHVGSRHETEIQPNELLEAEKHERMDFGAPTTAGRTHSAVEAVGEVNRSQKRQRKKQGSS